MKKTMMAMTMMFALGCFAQTSSTGSNSGSTAGQNSGASSSGNTSSDQNGSMNSSGSMNGNQSMSGGSMKGDKTLKGCVQSQNGNYMLEEKHGKMVMLTGSDLSAHVGHMVKVHGMWQSSSMSSGSTSGSMSQSSSGSTDNSGSTDHMGSMGNSSNGGDAVSKDAMSDSGKMDHQGMSFMVDKIDMVSDQCKMDKGMTH